MKLNRLDEAVAEYERVLRINSNFPRPQYDTARVRTAGKTARARETNRRFLEIWKNADPDAPELIDARPPLANLG